MNHPSQHLLSNRTRRFRRKKDFSLHRKSFEQDHLWFSFGKRHRNELTEGAAQWSAVVQGFCISWWNRVDEVLQEHLFGIQRNSLVLVRRCLRDSLFLASVDKKTKPSFTDREMFDQSELLMPNSVYSANGWVSISSLSLSSLTTRETERERRSTCMVSSIRRLESCKVSIQMFDRLPRQASDHLIKQLSSTKINEFPSKILSRSWIPLSPGRSECQVSISLYSYSKTGGEAHRFESSKTTSLADCLFSQKALPRAVISALIDSI